MLPFLTIAGKAHSLRSRMAVMLDRIGEFEGGGQFKCHLVGCEHRPHRRQVSLVSPWGWKVGELSDTRAGAPRELGFYLISDGGPNPYSLPCAPAKFHQPDRFLKDLCRGHTIADLADREF